MQRDYMQEHTDFIDYRLGNVHEDLKNENKILFDEIRLLREQLQNSEAKRQEQQRQLAELSRQQEQIKQQEAERLRVEKERLAEQQRIAEQQRLAEQRRLDEQRIREKDFKRMAELKDKIRNPYGSVHKTFYNDFEYQRYADSVYHSIRNNKAELLKLNTKYGLPELEREFRL